METHLSEIENQNLKAVSDLEQKLIKNTVDMEQKVLETADTRLEEYREVQREQYRRLEKLVDDSAVLDGEIRLFMQEMEKRVHEDFSRFEKESAESQGRATLGFNAALDALKAEMADLEKELNLLKNTAYENVSAKLKIFEDDFFADISRRSSDIDRRLNDWQTDLDSRMVSLAGESEAKSRRLEMNNYEELKALLAENDERLKTELENLRSETNLFEEEIRAWSKSAEESLDSFKEHLTHDLEETRLGADITIKNEIGRHALNTTDALKQNQRDLEARLRNVLEDTDERREEIAGLMETSRRELEEWQQSFTIKLRDLDAAVEESRGKARGMVAESEEKIAGVHAAIDDLLKEMNTHRTEIFSQTEEKAKILDNSIKEAERHIKEFIAQTRLFDRAEEMKTSLEHQIEDIQSDLNGLDQRRAEIVQMESQFAKIRRLEDEINSKMTRFLSEQRRIEQMETGFNRLLQTSTAVEEKLLEVNNSNDAIQAMQVQIRRLDEALTQAEEKYQRIERKNQILEETNNGIDRNFSSLQSSELKAREMNEELSRIAGDVYTVRTSVEELAEREQKAREASEKIASLDETLKEIETRIERMQKTRELLASAETRMEQLLGLSKKLFKGGDAEKAAASIENIKTKPSTSIQLKEDVIKLTRMGWDVKEIANILKISRSEVEMIQQLGIED
jgi:DNA repair exonuclease SbcCD ATPase subunit